MTGGGKLEIFWTICWKFVTPLIFLVRFKHEFYYLYVCLPQFLFIFEVIYHDVPQHEGHFYPTWALALGIISMVFVLLWVLAYPAFYLVHLLLSQVVQI